MKKYQLTPLSFLILAFAFSYHLKAQNDTIPGKESNPPSNRNFAEISYSKNKYPDILPFRSLNGYALTSENTHYLKYNRLFTDGLEATGGYFFIDGMQVEDGNDFPVRSIGSFQHYRLNQPIRYGNVAGSLIEVISDTYTDKLHFEAEGYSNLKKGYNNYTYEISAGGPIRFGKDKTKNKFVPGFQLAANFSFTNNPNLGSEKKMVATSETLNSLSNNPLVLAEGISSATYLSSYFLGQNDFKEVNARQNADRQMKNIFFKLNFPLRKHTTLSLGSYAKFDKGKEFIFENALLNSDHNPETFYRHFDNYLSFARKNLNIGDMKIGFEVNLQYSYYNFQRYDPEFKDRYFEYGYLGKFTTTKIPTYELVEYYEVNGVTYENVYLLNSWDFDTAYTFQNLNINPERARFTEQIYELFPTNWEQGATEGNWSNSDQLQLRGGLLNGQNPDDVYYLWNSQSTMMNNYGFSEREKYRGAFRVEADYRKHHFFVGAEYVSKTERQYTINPLGLWGRMRALTNFHLRELDMTNPQMDQYASDNIIYFYRKYDEQSQFDIDKNLRHKLGLPVDGLDFILTDSYDMINNTIDYYDKNGVMHTMKVPENLFTLDLFSPAELLNDGHYIVNPVGYDYLGNKLKGKQSEYGFFENFLMDVYRPGYFSTYLGDYFEWKSVDLKIGLRIDNFNANQPKLKDPFLLYPAKTVGETTVIGGTPVTHPGNMDSDYVVYVDNIGAPTEITGYRDGFTWYNSSGVEIQDPTQLDRGSGISPYLANQNQISVNPSAFENCKGVTSVLPQVNLNLPVKKYGDVYFDFNSFSQNPTAYHTFRPDQYYFINSISGIFSNPALKPMRIYKSNFGLRPRIYKTLFADLACLWVHVKDYPYLATLVGAYPREYTTVLNREDAINTQSLKVAVDYYSTKSSGLNAGSSVTKTFVSVEDRAFMNISDVVCNTHITYQTGNGKDFVFRNSKVLRAIFQNFNIGLFHQHRAGTELPAASVRLNSTMMNPARYYSYSPDIDLVNLKIEKGFFMPRMGITVSFYLWIENLFNKQNLFYINPETGEPDDDDYLSAPEWQNQINSQVNPASYRMLYQYKLMNPDYYDIPRIVRAGIIVKL
ncbi:MAG: hypothetical protein FJY07_05885 [Bacteroidetes bacterium]|nr:hypothetical protein [Bacteroidota bacterium]